MHSAEAFLPEEACFADLIAFAKAKQVADEERVCAVVFPVNELQRVRILRRLIDSSSHKLNEILPFACRGLLLRRAHLRAQSAPGQLLLFLSDRDGHILRLGLRGCFDTDLHGCTHDHARNYLFQRRIPVGDILFTRSCPNGGFVGISVQSCDRSRAEQPCLFRPSTHLSQGKNIPPSSKISGGAMGSS